MRNTRIGQHKTEPWPWRWQLICRRANPLVPIPEVTRIANRAWNDEVVELVRWGFRPTWTPSDCETARSFVCELCGNDMDLRAFVEPELGKRTYAYCTMAGCHWWLEF
jgi:hypothetical protein